MAASDSYELLMNGSSTCALWMCVTLWTAWATLISGWSTPMFVRYGWA